MNAEQLNAIKERAAKAMPGPWYRGEGYEQMYPGYYVASEANGLIVLAEEEGILRDEDVQFIAHAREDVPALVAEVERLNSVKHRLNSDVELYRKQYEGAQIQLSESEAENACLRKALEEISEMFVWNSDIRDARKIAREALAIGEESNAL